uniref:Uncharacterized protein n=1 Tax=Rhizophora mucronata TaxID=61149 RepID=A0A2P2N6K5_RHIMU
MPPHVNAQLSLARRMNKLDSLRPKQTRNSQLNVSNECNVG